jgi:tetratricopeptide (TPR) repeat protein
MTGQTLGHYRIQEKLGAGGMGVVYRAHDTMLERPAAVKVIEERTSTDEAARARLLREARMASALNHPNICTVYEVGVAGPPDAPQTYIAMELIEGRPLDALIPAGGLPLERTLYYGTQIADALTHAHDHGVVHRDLKSANVMVLPDGRIKLLDFGLAKRLEAATPDAATVTREQALTRAGVIVGTLAYMSPEAICGDPVDERSDIWSFGVLLHEMASGRRPFEGTGLLALTGAILRDAIPELPPGSASQVQPIVRRCLAKAPGQRYQRAGEARAALDAIGATSQTVPAGAAPRVSRRRWRWAAVGAVALAAAAVVGILQWRQPRPYAPLASKVPEANEYLRLAEYAFTTQQEPARIRQLLEKALELDPSFVAARVLNGFGYLMEIDQGQSNDTTWLYRAEAELRRALADDPNSARAHAVLGFVYFYQGRKDLIPEEARRAIALDPDEKDGYMQMAFYHVLNGDYEPAQAIFKKLLDADPLFSPARVNFAENLRLMGDTQGAIKEHERVRDQDPRNVVFVPFLALAHMTAGDVGRARQTLEHALVQQPQNYLFRLLWALELAVEGKRDEALRAMDQGVLKYAELVMNALFAAEFYAVLGDKPAALDWLDRDVRAGDERADWFARDPLLANIREEPRFVKILDSIRARQKQRAASSR